MMVLPDQAERTRALTDHASTLLIEAGAGSGKTSLMAGRVALMLAAGISPRNIAAITFTELAAGQLFTRISEFVDELLGGSVPYNLVDVLPNGLDDDQRVYLERAHQSLGTLMVTTIHGFCQQLIRPYPVEAKVDQGARVIDEAEAALAWQDLLQRFLRDRLDAEADNSALTAFVQISGDKAEAEIVKLAEFLRRHRTARPAEVLVSQDALDAFRTAVDGFVDWFNSVGYTEETSADLAGQLRDLADEFGQRLIAGSDTATIIRLALDPLKASAHTQKFTWRSWGRKGKWQTAAAAAGFSKADGGRVSDQGDALYNVVGDAWAHLQGAISAAAFRLFALEFDELLERYGAYKREAALLDFDDLLLIARNLLRTNDDVRLALAGRYKHVLVDEFQDTDPIQAEILWRLCGEDDEEVDWRSRQLRAGALFCVGDPKQAIYRFRGADIDTYVEAREAIGAQFPGNILEISANFRSLRPILEWVNERFAEPLSAEGQPGFQDLTSTQEPADDLPKVTRLDVEVVFVGEKPTPNEAREAEAKAVAELCQRLIGSHLLQDRNRNHDPLVKPGDIALLAPGGTQLWRYERALERLGIPVASQAGKGFFRRQEIQDLIAITRVLADSRDTVAFGALLRGPLVGLSEEEILDVIANLPTPEDPSFLPRLSLWTEPSEIAHLVAKEIVEILQGLARKARSTTPFELLAEAVEELRVRPILKQRHPGGAERALANVDRYLEMARPHDVRGLVAFAANMRAKWENSESEIEGRPDAEEQAVRLITMHSAKGLEWPIVIPVNAMTTPKSASGLLHDRSADTLHYHLGPVSDATYQATLNDERTQQECERIRLLYVACTRAAELLVLPNLSEGKPGWLGLVDLGIGELPPIDLSNYDPVLPQSDIDQENGQNRDAFAAEAMCITQSTQTIEWRQPSRHEMRDEDAALAGAVSEVFVEEEEQKPVVLGGPLRGTVLHKLIEEVLMSDVADDVGSLEIRATELLAQLGEGAGEGPAKNIAPSELAQVIINALALPEVAAIRDRLNPEFAIFGHYSEGIESEKEIALSGVADAVAFAADGKIEVVVDWKSDVSPTVSQRAKYRAQVTDYIRACGGSKGMVVYLTLGEVENVS